MEAFLENYKKMSISEAHSEAQNDLELQSK